jgi:hypothetical protein
LRELSFRFTLALEETQTMKTIALVKTNRLLTVRVLLRALLLTGWTARATPIAKVLEGAQSGDLSASQTKYAAFYLLTPNSALPR